MSELKKAVGRSQGVGFLEDHTHAMNLDARAELQLHQLSEAMATMQVSLKKMQDQLASELVEVSRVSFISRSFTKNWLTTEGCNGKFVFYFASSRNQTTAPSSKCRLRASSRQLVAQAETKRSWYTLSRGGPFRDVWNVVSLRLLEGRDSGATIGIIAEGSPFWQWAVGHRDHDSWLATGREVRSLSLSLHQLGTISFRSAAALRLQQSHSTTALM